MEFDHGTKHYILTEQEAALVHLPNMLVHDKDADDLITRILASRQRLRAMTTHIDRVVESQPRTIEQKCNDLDVVLGGMLATIAEETSIAASLQTIDKIEYYANGDR